MFFNMDGGRRGGVGIFPSLRAFMRVPNPIYRHITFIFLHIFDIFLHIFHIILSYSLNQRIPECDVIRGGGELRGILANPEIT
mgnify:CR=1 FL=1